MRGGHNVKSENDLKKSGTWRQDRHSGRMESTIKPLETLPEPPGHFDKRHAAKWSEVCGNVAALTSQDLDALDMYVTNFFFWLDASAEVAKAGITFVDENGKIILNPAFRVMQEAGKVILQVGDKFGFSPRARMGIKTPKGDGREKTKSILGLIKGGTLKKVS